MSALESDEYLLVTLGENSLFAIKIYSASLFAIEKVFFPNLPLS